MKKLESSLKNMVLSLTGFTIVAGALLGWVNEVTSAPIAQAKAKSLSDAIAMVVPGFDNNPAGHPDTVSMNGIIYKIYKATRGGEFIGAAVESSANGFGGTLTVLVGFDAEGRIIDYSLLNHSETPGLGSKAAEWFKEGGKGDIIGMNPGETPLTVKKDGGNVDAITASTITSRAFLKAVNSAYAAYAKQNGMEVGEELNGATGASKKSHGKESGGEAKEDTDTNGTTGASTNVNVREPKKKEVKIKPEGATGASKKANRQAPKEEEETKEQNAESNATTGASKKNKQEDGRNSYE